MNSFSVDLGFDWNIEKEGLVRHLQENFFMQLPTIGIASYFRVIAVGDMLTFNVYDITMNLTNPSGPSEPMRTIMAGSVIFRSADGSTPSNPFGLPAGEPIPLPLGEPLDVSECLTFNGRYPHWADPKPYKVITPGRFMYKAELTVQQDGVETKIFFVDPEMEIGPG